MEIQEHVALAPLTTFHIGGPARYFALVQNIEEMCEALAFAKARALKTFILGGGSNLLFDDTGFGGLVIKIDFLGVEEEKVGEDILFVASAGENWDALVERAVAQNLWGLENLSGIPGTVGGAVVQNIGAYGAALSRILSWVEVFDITTEEVKKLSLEDCQFGYRGSIFSAKGGSVSGGKNEDGHFIVLRAALRLSSTPNPVLSYKDLEARFKDQMPNLAEIRDAVLGVRAGKFPDLAFEGTAGSFFKNPVIPEKEAQKLIARYPGMPTFALPESTDIKIPLGWFLDYRHGVIDMRGVRVGGARMYEKQFLVLVAEKNCSSKDVKKLAELVQEKVRKVLGIEIEPEVRVVGK